MIQSPAGYQGDVRIKRYLDFYQAGYGVTMLSGATAFTPASLFAASVPGAWYDPSDFSTMFEDVFGTIPVTAVGQPVGLIRDKSRTINRVNLITNGTFTTNTTGWTAVDGSIAVVSGELEVTGSGGSYPRAQQTYNLVVGKTYRISATARRGTATGNAYIAHTSGALYAETSSTTNVTLTYTFRNLCYRSNRHRLFRQFRRRGNKPRRCVPGDCCCASRSATGSRGAVLPRL